MWARSSHAAGRWPASIAAAALAAVALAACATTASPPPQVPSASTASTSATASPPAARQPASPSTASPSATAPALHQVHDPGQVTGTLTGPCHFGAGGQLPDPSCTPGAYDPAIDAQVLCSGHYTTDSYRPPSSQTTRFKHEEAEPAYGQPVSTVGELDHLVPLTLGGANDAANLWVEAGPMPNGKDPLEVRLHHWVCAASGQAAETRLHEAQVAIASNWTTAEQVLGIR